MAATISDEPRANRPVGGREPKQPSARLFLALWPSPLARRALADWSARWTWPRNAAIVPPEKWHLTLHFLGQVPVRRLPELVAAFALPCPRLNLAFGNAEVWPRGIALVHPLEVPAALLDLHERLAQALHRLDLPVERRTFRPHVTLARQATGAVPPPIPPAFDWPVRRFALVQSEGGYRTLARFPE